MVVAQAAQAVDPVAPWALALALISLVVTAGVGVYTARTNRRTARENAELASWPALVAALEAEVARLGAQVARLERQSEISPDPGRGNN
jgi:hypothetical protein